MKKTVISVDLYCDKGKRDVMKTVGKIMGVNSVSLDEEKNTVTVVGLADPVVITKKVREKCYKSAHIVSVGPDKPPPPPPPPPKATPPEIREVLISYGGGCGCGHGPCQCACFWDNRYAADEQCCVM